MALAAENLPLSAGDPRETEVQSLGWECPLQEEMAPLGSLPGKSHGQRSLAGYSPWDHK